MNNNFLVTTNRKLYKSYILIKSMENNHINLIPKKFKELAWPEAYFLTEEQQAVYEESIKKYSGKARESLNVPRAGSNLFKVLLLNQEGIRTAILSELEQAIDNGMQLKGFYEDIPSVVLRSNGDSYQPNDYLAKYLAKKTKKRNFKHPLVLNGLKLEENSNSAYGLVLVPGENFEYFEAPELDYENNRKRFSTLNERGMPIFDKNGNRTLYTKDDGLCRLCSDDALFLYSYYDHLEDSDAHGRVVVVSPEGVKKNLEQYIIQAKKAREDYLTRLTAVRDQIDQELKSK